MWNHPLLAQINVKHITSDNPKKFAMFTGKLGKIALSLVNMDVLPEIMHDSFPRRYMGVEASLRRRSPRTWVRYRENVRRFLDGLPTPFYGDFNLYGLKIHRVRHFLLFRCFILYLLELTTLSELCKNCTCPLHQSKYML